MYKFLLFIFVVVYSNTYSQNVGINISGVTPDASAILDISSTEQGLLIPRLTDAQRQALQDPAIGLMIYNTTSNELNFYDGAAWESLPANSVSVISGGGAGPGGGIAINTSGNNPDPSAILDVSSTEKGVLIPRTTPGSVSATTGLMIYNTTTNKINYYNGSAWKTPCEQTSIDNYKGIGASSAGIGISSTGTTGDASAILDVSSSTQGLLIPRMTDAQRDAIQTPAQGLLVYNTTTNLINYWTGTAWYELSSIGTGFQTEWTTTVPGETITLPLNNSNSSAFNCTVDWGDASSSTITAWNDVDITHAYAAAGVYTVEITGQCEGWSFSYGGDYLKITNIISWGDPCVFDGFKFLSGGFAGCSNLTSIGAGSIPSSGVGCADFISTFENCPGLTGSIPPDLFRYHTLVSSAGFASTFYGCSALTGGISSNLFRYNTLVTDAGFQQTFYDCSGLTGSIPSDLFRYNTLVALDAFYRTFYNCTSLTSIPTDLFKYNILVSGSGFTETFKDCSGLTGAIPTDLFRYNTLVALDAFYRTFNNCTGLTSIPSDLFKYNILVSGSGFTETFKNCSGLTGAIPTDLFRYNILVSDFSETFYSCSGLTGAIPTDLFRYNTAVVASGFYQTFRGCSGLTTIPADLFRYNTLVSSSAFNGTFWGCSGLTAIPTDLFRYNTAVSTLGFNATFWGCSGLTAIPTDLFRYNIAVSSSGFNSTFLGCSGLTAIPTDLFRYNTAVSTSGFSQTFFGCSGITSAPVDLFRYNTSCTSFLQTFSGCTKLQLNRNIFFADGEEATRFLNQSINFTNCFLRVTFNGAQGEAPYLWLCNFGTGTPTKTSCWGGPGNSTTSLTNYPHELITLDVSPATDWAAGDVITGQTSGRTCTVVSKITATTYIVNSRGGLSYTLGEIIGVTGTPAKLADQAGARPTFANSGWR